MNKTKRLLFSLIIALPTAYLLLFVTVSLKLPNLFLCGYIPNPVVGKGTYMTKYGGPVCLPEQLIPLIFYLMCYLVSFFTVYILLSCFFGLRVFKK